LKKFKGVLGDPRSLGLDKHFKFQCVKKKSLNPSGGEKKKKGKNKVSRNKRGVDLVQDVSFSPKWKTNQPRRKKQNGGIVLGKRAKKEKILWNKSDSCQELRGKKQARREEGDGPMIGQRG